MRRNSVEQAALRTNAGVTVAELRTADKAMLLQCQQRIGLGNVWGRFVIPQEWVPPGGARYECHRTLNISEFLEGGARFEVDTGTVALTRLGLLYFMKPLPHGRSVILPSPATWRLNMRMLCFAYAHALRVLTRDPCIVFGRLTMPDLAGKKGVYRPTTVQTILMHLALAGLWTDTLKPVVRSDGLEATRRKPAAKRITPPKSSGFQPLSDEVAGAMGWRSAWLVRNIGASVVACLRAMTHAAETAPPAERARTVQSRVDGAIRRIVKAWRWQDSAGSELCELPFAMRLGGRGNRLRLPLASWPPQRPVQVLELAKLIQAANMFILFLSTGGRASEALSWAEDCLRTEGNAVAGQTFKPVPQFEGAHRTWPLPDVAIDALKLQISLTSAVSRFGRISHEGPRGAEPSLTSIWTRVGSGGDPLKGDYNYHLMKFASALGFDEHFVEESLHAHRFRKTLARLIALALVGAPKIVMDIFGHESIAQALHYMLADPAIKSEIAEVAKAQVIMFAEEAIRDAAASGGPAARLVLDAVEAEKARLGAEYGAESIHSLAKTMTFAGRTVQLVRPGVLCIKMLHQSGACNRRVGHPEPSKCRSECAHRLERGFLHDDVDRIIDESLANYRQCRTEDDSILEGYWAGQILANVRRFPDLLTKWSVVPEISALLNSPKDVA
jgi:integrase